MKFDQQTTVNSNIFAINLNSLFGTSTFILVLQYQLSQSNGARDQEVKSARAKNQQHLRLTAF